MSINDAGHYLGGRGLRKTAAITMVGFRPTVLLPEESPNRCQLCVVYWIDDTQFMASLLLKQSPESVLAFIQEHGQEQLCFTGRLAPHERFVDQSGRAVMPFTGNLTTIDLLSGIPA